MFTPFAFRNQVRVVTAAAATTLQYETIGLVVGTVNVYRNGSSIASLTTDTALTSVTINAGDTVQMTLTGGDSKFVTYIYYFLNNSLQTTYTGQTTISTAVITTSAGNTYYFSYQGSA
jgi:hypothetical protein